MKQTDKVRKWKLKSKPNDGSMTAEFKSLVARGKLSIMQYALTHDTTSGCDVLLIDADINENDQLKIVRFKVYDPVITRMRGVHQNELLASTIRIISPIQCTSHDHVTEIITDCIRLTRLDGTLMTIHSNALDVEYKGLSKYFSMDYGDTVPEIGYVHIDEDDEFSLSPDLLKLA